MTHYISFVFLYSGLLLHLVISDISHVEVSTLHNPITVDAHEPKSTQPHVSSADIETQNKVHGHEETTAIPELTPSRKPSKTSHEETTAIPELTPSRKPSNTKDPASSSMKVKVLVIVVCVILVILLLIGLAFLIMSKRKRKSLKMSAEARGSPQEMSSGQSGPYQPVIYELKRKQQNQNRSNDGNPQPEV